jgi:hypothetical protein
MKKLCLVFVVLSTMAAKLHPQPSERPVVRPIGAIITSPQIESGTMEFIPNLGQLSGKHGEAVPEVTYYSHYRGLTVYFSPQAMHFYFSRLIKQPDAVRNRTAPPMLHDPRHDTLLSYRVDLSFVGANPAALISPEGLHDDRSNYYIPRFPNGLTDVPAYGALLYREIYPKVDMRVYSTERGMKYDFIIKPGGDPSVIRMKYDGPDSLVDESNQITIYSPFGTITESTLFSYQPETSDVQRSNRNIPILSRYVLDHDQVSFFVGAYDTSRVLVIDPPRLWGTYFGGASYEYFVGNRVDNNDNIYVTGTCLEPGFGTAGTHQDTLNTLSGAPYDGIIAKFSPSGARLWSTYYGAGLTEGWAVAIDRSGNVVVDGETIDDTCIATTGAFQTRVNAGVPGDRAWDGFVARFDSLGHRFWGTYFGSADTDLVYDIAADSSNNIIVVGYSSSTTGLGSPSAFKTSRTRTTSYDYGGFIAKFSSGGSRLWSTYYGDTNTNCLGVSIVAGDSIVVSGTSYCKAGIATPGGYQSSLTNYVAGYLVKFSPSGTRGWGTYVDGAAGYYGTALYGNSAGADGLIYTCGLSWCATGLGTANGYRTSILNGTDGSFLEIFDSRGNRTAGTYIGNSYRGEYGFRVAVDPSGNALVGGWTSDSVHIASAGAFQSTIIDTNVSFMAKFAKDASRRWGSYFAGNGHPGGWDPIYGVAIDHHGHPIVSGATGSDSGIATIGSFQSTYGGGVTNYADGFIEKFCDTLKTPLQFASDSVICFGSIDTLATTPGYASYQWRRGGVSIPGATLYKYGVPQNQPPGTYRYTVDIADPRICVSTTDTLKLVIRSTPNVNAGVDKATCLNTSVQIGNAASGGLPPYQYAWVPDSGLSSATVATPTATPKRTTQYIEIVTDSNGCQARDTVVVTIRSLPQMIAAPNLVICTGGSTPIGNPATNGTAPYTYSWSPTTGLSATNVAQPIASPATSTTFRAHITDANGCDSYDTINVIITAPPNVTLVPSGAQKICVGDSIRIYAPTGMLAYLWSDGEKGASILVRQASAYSVAIQDVNGCSGTSDTVVVSTVAAPLPVIAGPDAACPSSIATYTTPFDPSARYRWKLSGGGTITNSTTLDSIVVNWTAAGKWIITLRDSNTAGCQRDTSFTVTIGTTLTPSVSPAGPILLCRGDSTVLHAQKGFIKYLWSSGQSSDSIVVSSTGNYSVTVTGTGGCSGTSLPVAVSVSPNPKPTPKLAATRTIVCIGDSLPLTTTKSFASYLWSNGAATPSINVSQAGVYFVIVTNADGCVGNSDPITITTSPVPQAAITPNGPLTFCSGDSVLLSATLGAVKYNWANGDTTSSVVAKTTGDYSVAIQNAAGCAATSAIVHVIVGIQPAPVIAGPSAVCPNSQTNYKIAAVAGSTYRWVVTGGTLTTGQTTNSIGVTWGASGNATIQIVQVDPTAGCTGLAKLDITIDNNLVPAVTALGGLSFCQGDSVTLDAGAGYATYQWQLSSAAIVGATQEKLTVSNSGLYNLFVTNSGSCQGTSNAIRVVVNPLPPAPIITQSGSTLTSSASSKYQWSLNCAPLTGAIMQSFIATKAGDYRVTIFDQNGCSNTSAPLTYRDSGMTVVAVPLRLQANPSDPVQIPIELLLSQNVLQSGPMHFTATLRFNKTLLAPSGQTPRGVISGNDMIVTISGTNPLPLGTTTGTLKTLDFIATLGSDTCTDVTIDAFQWTDGAVSVSRQSGRFCLTGVCEAGGTLRLIDPTVKLSLSQSHPNPATGSAQVEYDLREQGETSLIITDLMGRTVKTVVTGIQIPGHYSAKFDLNGFAQGTYIYVLQTPNGKLSHMMQIIR